MSGLIYVSAIFAAIAVAATVWFVLPSHGEHAAPRRDAPEPLPPWQPPLAPHKPVDGHPPWQPAEQLEPLPEPVSPSGSDRHADDLADAGGMWHGPDAPDEPSADEAIQHAAEHFNPPKPEPVPESSYDVLIARFERLFRGTLPTWAAEINHWHTDNTAAVESMYTRAEAERVRALTNGQVSDG